MIAVIGCGNPNRSDDGVAGEVLRRLKAPRSHDVKLLDAGTDGIAVMFAARGCQRLILVDACRTGAEPGTVFEVPGAELDRHDGPPLATHAFRWDDAIVAGRRLYREQLPDDVTVFLVEAKSVDFGMGLSPEVSASAAIVANRIALLIERDVAP